MAVTYSKLKSGEWGIRSDRALTIGGTIVVVKKSGETKMETVGTLVWSGNGAWLYAVGARAQAPRSSSGSSRSRGYGGPLKGGRYDESDPNYYSSGQYDDES